MLLIEIHFYFGDLAGNNMSHALFQKSERRKVSLILLISGTIRDQKFPRNAPSSIHIAWHDKKRLQRITTVAHTNHIGLSWTVSVGFAVSQLAMVRGIISGPLSTWRPCDMVHRYTTAEWSSVSRHEGGGRGRGGEMGKRRRRRRGSRYGGGSECRPWWLRYPRWTLHAGSRAVPRRLSADCRASSSNITGRRNTFVVVHLNYER